jgi:hypothetical protein
MEEKLRFLGLDVDAETIAEPDGEVRSLGTIPNRVESIRKLIKKLGSAEKMRACYEAGPTGYVVYWQLAELGVQCEVVAPTLVPMKVPRHVCFAGRGICVESHIWLPGSSSSSTGKRQVTLRNYALFPTWILRR